MKRQPRARATDRTRGKSANKVAEKQLEQWLRLMDGPGWKGTEARDRAVQEMQAFGKHRLFPILATKLTDPDLGGGAVIAILLVDAKSGQGLVLPLLHHQDSTLRWHTCGCLHDLGDERAVVPLVEVLKKDPDPTVRSQAAYALGGICSPAAIPALIESMNSDFEEKDNFGFTPGDVASDALGEIDEAYQPRQPGESRWRVCFDPDRVARLRELHREWLESTDNGTSTKAFRRRQRRRGR